MKTRCSIFVSILFAAFLNVYSQERPIKRCRVSTITFEQGLLNNGTSNIITDRSGYTWVSTLSGIQRYNGYTLEQVNPVIGKDTFHITNSVYFFGMKNGSIWISYRNGILSYDPASKKFKTVISLKTGEHFFFPVVPLYESGETIWCIKEQTGIVTLDHNGKQTEVLPGLAPAETDNI